jgi:putative ABC transport system ATP-binding protein
LGKSTTQRQDALDLKPAILELRHIGKAYPSAGDGRQVLTDLSYTLRAGEYVAIMGESGVGKSTLLNLIAGLDMPDTGEILIDGITLSSLDDYAATRLRRREFGFIFQAYHVLPHLTLSQNIALPLLLNDLPVEGTEHMLDSVGLAGRGHHFPRHLSGGELQRVAIARALVHRPKLILADEPTGNLDPDTAHDILMLMRREIKANSASGIIVTHSHAAAATADCVLVLTKDGLHPFVAEMDADLPKQNK